MNSKRKSIGQGGSENRVVYSEFGNSTNSEAVERPIAELPSNQQKLRVQASRKGRKGKTVTVISGFQAKPETLADLLKTLKTQCGAGGTIEENEILIQGDHVQKLVQLLKQMGYSPSSAGRS